MMGCIAAGPTGKRRSSPPLSPRLLCVFQSFFWQVLFTHSSELQELLCPRPYRNAGPPGRGPAAAAWLTCRGGEWAECSQVAGDSGDLVLLEQRVEFFFSDIKLIAKVYILIKEKKEQVYEEKRKLFPPASQAVTTICGSACFPLRLWMRV